MVDTHKNNIVITSGSATTRKSSVPTVGSRPPAPWAVNDLPSHNKNEVMRRHSAANIYTDRSPAFEDLPANPPLPSAAIEEKKSKMKKSETFYARFVKNVLSPTRKQSKDTRYEF
jgi:hypothetical protein